MDGSIFWESNFLGESKILEELQIHVEKHHIKATDAISLKSGHMTIV